MEVRERSFDDLPRILHAGLPAILSDVPWRALTAWSPDYLRRAIGEERSVNVLVSSRETRSFLYGPAQQTEQMQFGRFLSTVFEAEPDPARVHYLWAHGGGCWDLLDTIRQDLEPPKAIDGRPFTPAASGLWIGQGTTCTLIHCDADHGLIAQVRGRKRVLMFPPSAPVGYFLGGLARSRGARNRKVDLARGRLEFYDGLKRVLEKRGRPVELVLEEGKALYVPPYWWHEVENLTPTIAVSLRYAPVSGDIARHPGVYLAALWHHGKGYFLRFVGAHRPRRSPLTE